MLQSATTEPTSGKRTGWEHLVLLCYQLAGSPRSNHLVCHCYSSSSEGDLKPNNNNNNSTQEYQENWGGCILPNSPTTTGVGGVLCHVRATVGFLKRPCDSLRGLILDIYALFLQAFDIKPSNTTWSHWAEKWHSKINWQYGDRLKNLGLHPYIFKIRGTVCLQGS